MLTDTIAKLIEQMLNEAGGSLELQRNDMASRLGCVPSQISYVITSRFTPERGYIIESKRGGGGCIRIVKKQMQRDEYLMHFFYAIGSEMDERTLDAYVSNLLDNGFIDEREKNIICAATSGAALSSLPQEFRNNLRAQIFRHIILSIMR
jgi:transcriptional regulator CtsR